MNTNTIIDLTPAAMVHIQKWIAKEQGCGLRVSVKKVGCSGLKYVTAIVKKPESTDEKIMLKSLLPNQPDIIIFIDHASKAYIAGMLIDYAKPEQTPGVKSLQNACLIFRNPNEKGSCGCGESFTV